ESSSGGAPPGESAVPLCAALPDGTQLRLVRLAPGPRSTGVCASESSQGPAAGRAEGGQERSEQQQQQRTTTAGTGSQGLLQERSEQQQQQQQQEAQRSCSRFLEASDPLAMIPGGALSTDLANERTLLAWIRTALAVTRTIFSYATLGGLTQGVLLLDVTVTICLASSSVAALLVGWQRFGAIRKAGVAHTRRISICPLFSVFVAIAAITCVATLIRQPRRLGDQPTAEIAWGGLWQREEE
ncbi:unnamed protein product, partial [Polarella glacialis]